MKTTTICDLVAKMPQRNSNKPALLFKKDSTWQKLSWPEYYAEIESVGVGLLTIGAQVGDTIAIMSNTRLEWSTADHAIAAIHGVVVPIYQTVTPDDLAFILNNSKVKIIFIENKNILKSFNQIKNHCPSVQHVISFDGEFEDVLSWQSLKDQGLAKNSELRPIFEKLIQSTQLEQTATILYTSGTTGQPKGVVLTHRQIISEVSEAFPQMGATSADTSLSFLPYAHIMGRIENWGHIHTGFTMAFAESIDKVKTNMIEVQPTFMIAVPRIFEKIYTSIVAGMEANRFKSRLFKWAINVGKAASEYQINREPIPAYLLAELILAKKLVLNKVKDAFGGKIRFCVSGGAPLSKDIAMFFHACEILILEGYGLTETTAAICINTPYDYRFGSVGKPIGDVQLKIAEDGEILVKSDKVMKEYYQDSESSAAAFTAGWFHTGDIGEILSSGDLKITDRKKDLIKTGGGKYVAPQRLENLLKMTPVISNSLIHGDQKKYIVALITLDKPNVLRFAKDHNLEYEDFATLTQHPTVLELVRKAVAEANSHLASFESIKRFAILPMDFTVEAGELTPSLKVKRKVLDQKYRKQIDSLYS